eukprot:jgi/Psemu1/288658/fgenesh1_pg.282_\
MAGYVVGNDDDRVRKRRVARDPSPVGRGGTRMGNAEPNRRQNGMKVKSGSASSFSHKARTKKDCRRKSSSLISRWIMNLGKSQSPAVIGMVVVVSVVTLAVLAIAAILGFFSSSNTNGCIESHINGISGNIYHWCYKHESAGIQGRISRSLSQQPGIKVKREIVVNNHAPFSPNEIVQAINSHERLSHEIVASDQGELCYAELDSLGDWPDDPHAYHQPAIGPCHYDYPLTHEPLAGNYEEMIDFYFFRESEESRYSDRLKCFNKCVDRALAQRQNDATRGKHHGHIHQKTRHQKRNLQISDERSLNEINPDERVPADDVMLIEAARAGMTLVVEKLLLEYGLDPFYRQVKNDPGNARSLNAIQEAIRGGYAEIVATLTAGDNSVVIDEYGRTVEDYVTMSGSPIRPIDAMNVLGIQVEDGNHKRPQEKYDTQQDSGWSETTAHPYDKERCDFDIVDGDLDPNVFYRDYFITGRPVVLRGQSSQRELGMFSKHRWYKNKHFHPDQKFEVGPTAYPPLTNQESCQKHQSINELEQGKVCEEMPEKPMVHAFHPRHHDFKELYPDFKGKVLDKRGGFRSIQHFFRKVQGQNDLVWQVFFGGDGSGATFHWHEAAFNILYVGVKEWKIAPPMYRGTTGMTAEQVAEILDPKISLTCVQQPGDMFYIPNYWGHSTFNHGFTIGAAAIVTDWFQNSGATLRGAQEEEEEENNEVEYEEGEEEGEEEGDPPFLFVHINKTGGTSLISMFSERCGEEYWGGQWLDSDGGFHRAFHSTAHAYIEKYGREAWDNAYTFTVVRHPLARQVSNFFFLASMGCEKRNSKCEERLIPTLDLDSMSDEEKIEAFHEWIVKLYNAFPPGSPEHYRFGAAGHGNEVYDTFGATQTSWNVDANGDMVVKHFFKLEELSKDISELADNIPCLKNGPLNMAKENKTSKYPNFMLFAKDEQTKNIINEVFADDFRNFGYKPL